VGTAGEAFPTAREGAHVESNALAAQVLVEQDNAYHHIRNGWAPGGYAAAAVVVVEAHEKMLCSEGHVTSSEAIYRWEWIGHQRWRWIPIVPSTEVHRESPHGENHAQPCCYSSSGRSLLAFGWLLPTHACAVTRTLQKCAEIEAPLYPTHAQLR
jgi:hypothetical protein